MAAIGLCFRVRSRAKKAIRAGRALTATTAFGCSELINSAKSFTQRYTERRASVGCTNWTPSGMRSPRFNPNTMHSQPNAARPRARLKVCFSAPPTTAELITKSSRRGCFFEETPRFWVHSISAPCAANRFRTRNNHGLRFPVLMFPLSNKSASR